MNRITLNLARVVFMAGILIGLYSYFFRWHDSGTVIELCVIGIGIQVLFRRRGFMARRRAHNPRREDYFVCAHRDLDENRVCRTCGFGIREIPT